MKIAICILAVALVVFIFLYILAECAFREATKDAAQNMVHYFYEINDLNQEIEQLKRRIIRLEVIADGDESEGHTNESCDS